MAGPRWPDRGTRVPTEGIAIQIVLDASGSMAERDFSLKGQPLSRLEAAKETIRSFIRDGDRDSQDLIGLVVFARWPDTVCPPTLSHETLLTMLDKQRPHVLPIDSQSNIGDALAIALHRLEKIATVRKAIVLVSDGEHNVPTPALTPDQAARLVASRSVPIYAIYCGPAKAGADYVGPNERAFDRAKAQASLEHISQMTGGRYFQACDSRALADSWKQIAELQRSQIQSFTYRRYYEGYPWFGLAALLSWSLASALRSTVWRILPGY
jgi:Ca-activated chloride channel family protein